jgi:superfamily I DNA/RNA helicase/mRNA-degrading endonuclease RelE of RelBE toxin-antitoxin system
MEFRIADTFTDSLARLTGEEQKAVKTTAFDLQLNPAHPSLQFHKLDKAKDKRFWSVRVTSDIRLIVHRSEDSFLLCYADHHDQAYAWGEKRKLETHPKTGAAQLVEIRETVQEIIVPKYADVAKPKPLAFAHIPDSELLGYGIPAAWLEEVKAADEDSILVIATHLPAEAAEAVLDLAVGTKPKPAVKLPVGVNPFEHPDAQRRFRAMGSVEELARALESPWEKWTVFLHPAQRQLVERDYSGPARVAGSAGTGKTIVALHRAVFLARKHPDSRILLTTFSDNLASALRTKLRYLISNEPRLGERLEVHAINTLGRRLYELNFGPPKIASRDAIKEHIAQAAKGVEGNKFSLHFLTTEWEQVVDPWQLHSWEGYRDVPRLGRKTRLPEKQRAIAWAIFDRVRSELKTQHLITYPDLFSQLASKFGEGSRPPFDFTVIDEAQDVRIAQLRFLAALGANQPNRLFFAGDLGQRIFQQPFSWRSLGVDVRGRSSTLKINYRTSHQIRMQADRLLSPEVSDVDGNTEDRRGTISVFNGAPPAVQVLPTTEDEAEAVGRWLRTRVDEGIVPHEIGVFVRSSAEMARARLAAGKSSLAFKVLDENVETVNGYVSVGTMHLAKGLEFRAVAVMACDDEVIPLQERIEKIADESDLEEVYNTERHLLYVACTRARDHLLVTGVDPASEFLEDLGKQRSIH